MTQETQKRYSVEEYLELERTGSQKHEYDHGNIVALPTNTKAHTLIQSNILRSLNAQLRRRPCKVYADDMRLKIPATGLYTYPDISVVCGPTLFDDGKRDTLLNPTLIIEILSQSTESHDHGPKIQHYRRLESLSDYLLVVQSEPRIEHYVRQQNKRWLLISYTHKRSLCQLHSIDCSLTFDEVYNKVEFEK